jgi:hypothetical protein
MSSCPAGRYSSVYSTTSSNNCPACSAGYFCPQTSVNETECGQGFYSDSSASSCLTCPAGTYCSSNSTSLDNILNDGGSWARSSDLSGICFNGTYCSAGMKRVPDLLRDACPSGYYCEAGTTYPVPCPAGRYSTVSGQDEISDCQYTPAGFYSTSASSNVSGLCEPGYYCPLGSTGPQQIPCPSRYYRPEYGAASLSDCSLCVAGGYCPQASIVPTVCTRGYYCVTGLSTPLACPPGTYGNTTGLTSSDECTACDGGFYCDGYGLTTPRGLCEQGRILFSYTFQPFLLLLIIIIFVCLCVRYSRILLFKR